MTKSTIVLTGLVGLLGAVLTGVGEFILHFDALARFGAENEFFEGISDQRTTIGHFVGVLGAPLYLVGCWHIKLMLQPANKIWSMTAFFVAAYGFAVGAVWIGSRASISALVNAPTSPEIVQLMGLYDFRYETLLQIIRVTVLALSVIYISLTLTGRSHYPKWMAALNPILLILVSFIVYAVTPSIGKYLMPIALNVAFFVLFVASIMIASKKGV
ncbi:MAG: hypothetical protein IH838_06290 [Proteobacteria bacterium]|nr:hypothetical protein [Pseudomonadota bacterium]